MSAQKSRLFLIFFAIFAPLVSSVTQLQVIDPVILVEGETLNFQLNQFFSGMNVTYSFASTPNNNITIIPPFNNNTILQNFTQSNIAYNATYLDPQNFIFLTLNNSEYYINHYQISPLSPPNQILNQVISIPAVTCFSIIPWQDAYVITCVGFLNNVQSTSYTVYNSTSGITNQYTSGSYATGLNRPMAIRSKVFSGPQGQVIVSYIPTNSFTLSYPTYITVLDTSNLTSPVTVNSINAFSQNSALFSLEIFNNNLYIVGIDGTVYLASLVPGNQITIIDTIININSPPVFSTSVQNPIGNLATICTSNSVYYFNNWQMVSAFSIPGGFQVTNCTSDGRFVYVVGKNGSNPEVLVYSATELFSSNYLAAVPLISIPTNFQISNILGQVVFLTPMYVVWSQIDYPLLSFQATNSSEMVTLVAQDNLNMIQVSINVTILANNPSQIYLNVQSPLVGINGLNFDLSENIIAAGISIKSATSNSNNADIETIHSPCDLNFTLPYTFIQTIPGSIFSVNSSLSTISFFATGNPNNGSMSFIQAYRSFSHGCPVYSNFSYISYNQNVSGCIAGSVYSICLLHGYLAYVSAAESVQYPTLVSCSFLYLYDPVYYPIFASACIQGSTVIWKDIYANNLYQLNINELTGDMTNITGITSSPSSPEITFISTLNNIYAVSLPFMGNNNNIITSYLLSTFTSSFNITGIGSDSRSLIVYSIKSDQIAEWDVRDVINPYLRRNYNLNGLNLVDFIQYSVESNLFYFQASEQQEDYLLVIKPGLPGFNYLTYITSFFPASTMTVASQSFDGTDELFLFYPVEAASIQVFPIPKVTFNLVTTQYKTLNISTKALIDVSGFWSSQNNFTLHFSYLQPEQQIQLQNQTNYNQTAYMIREGVEITSAPSSYFAGNPLDYELENYVLDGALALNFQFPLNFSSNFQVGNIPGVPSNQNITDIMTSVDSLYILLYNGVLKFNSTVSASFTPIGSQSGNCTYGDTLANDIYQVYLCSTTANENIWNLLVLPSNLNHMIQDEVIDVKITGNGTIFVLSGSNPVTIYIYQINGNSLLQVSTINLLALGLNLIPTGFDVINVTNSLFLIQFVNGQDILYFTSVNLNGPPPYSINTYYMMNATSIFINDLPSEPVQIIGTLIMHASYVSNTMTAEILINIANFHSYEVIIQFNQTSISSISISRCFLQSSTAVSLNYFYRTSNYMFVVKKYEANYYLYSYPLNNTMTIDTNVTLNYSYNVPIQRVYLTSNLSFFQFAATDGNISTIFMASNGNQNTNTTVVLYNATELFQIGFNPNVSIRSFTELPNNFTYLMITNDYSNFTQEFILIAPFDILTASFFIIFTGIFTLLFICAFVCFARKYKQAKKTLQLSEYMLDSDI